MGSEDVKLKKKGAESDKLTNSTKPSSGHIRGQPRIGKTYETMYPPASLRTSVASVGQRAISTSLGSGALNRLPSDGRSS